MWYKGCDKIVIFIINGVQCLGDGGWKVLVKEYLLEMVFVLVGCFMFVVKLCFKFDILKLKKRDF